MSSWGAFKPNGIPKGNELVFVEGFGEPVSHLLIGSYIFEFDIALSNLLPNIVMLDVDMFGPGMKLGVLS